MKLHRILAATTALALLAAPVLAETIFTSPSNSFSVGRAPSSFKGYVDAEAKDGNAIHPGDTALIIGEQLVPGQQITLMRGTAVLNKDGALTVDAEGKFSLEVPVDADAAIGMHPIVVIAENPASATVIPLKVSPKVPLSGEDRFDIVKAPVARGLYQVATNGAGQAFVTAAVGRPPVKESTLTRVNAETLATEAQITPLAAPARPDGSDGGVFAVYGVGVDDANGNVWVTNSRQDTIAVYKQSDLSLVRQLDPGTVDHARDVVIDAQRGRAYVSASASPVIHVFDTKTFEELDPIQIKSSQRGQEFGTMSLDLDPQSGKLVTVSLTSPEAAVIDPASGKVEVLQLPGAIRGSGVAYDPKDGLLFVASQGGDNLLIAKAEGGEVLHDVKVGAGALNVAFEPVSQLAFVSSRDAQTITVVDKQGNIVANLDAGFQPNQLRADGKGNVYAVNKNAAQDSDEGGSVWKITPKK